MHCMMCQVHVTIIFTRTSKVSKVLLYYVYFVLAEIVIVKGLEMASIAYSIAVFPSELGTHER